MRGFAIPRSRRLGLPDPEKQFTEVPRRRVPQLEFGIRLPTFRANLDDTITVASSTETSVTWASWQNGDTRFYSENTSGSPAVVDTVDLLFPGVYAIMASLIYSSAFSASRHVIFLDDYVQDPLISVKAVHFGTTAADAFSYGDTLQVVRGFPVFASDTLTNRVATVHIKANQNSGAPRDLNNGILEIYYLGGLSVVTEEF